MVSRTMKRFDLHSKYPTACLHAGGPDASSTGALLLSLSTIAGTKISNPPWVNFQSAGWGCGQKLGLVMPLSPGFHDTQWD